MSLLDQAQAIRRIEAVLAELQKRLEANPLDVTAAARYKEYTKELERIKCS